MMIRINQKGLQQLNQRLLEKVLIPAMETGLEVSRANTPIDTSSLYTDTRIQNAIATVSMASAELATGGGDYRDRVMPMTGKQGNLVNYAIEQNNKHGFLEQGLLAIASELTP